MHRIMSKSQALGISFVHTSMRRKHLRLRQRGPLHFVHLQQVHCRLAAAVEVGLLGVEGAERYLAVEVRIPSHDKGGKEITKLAVKHH